MYCFVPQYCEYTVSYPLHRGARDALFVGPRRHKHASLEPHASFELTLGGGAAGAAGGPILLGPLWTEKRGQPSGEAGGQFV